MRVRAAYYGVIAGASTLSIGAGAAIDLALLPAEGRPLAALVRVGSLLLFLGLYLVMAGKRFRLYAPDLSTIQHGDPAVFRERIVQLGETPLKLFLGFLLVTILAGGVAQLLQNLTMGTDRARNLISIVFNVSVAFYLSAFLYVLQDRVVMETLLAQKITAYPADLLERRQRTKNIIIPVFMSIMAMVFSYSLAMGAAYASGDGTAGQTITRWILVGGGIFQAIVTVLVLQWANNTGRLYQLLLERLSHIASEQKDLTGRVFLASVDEMASMVGHINAFSDMIKRDFTEIKGVYGRFDELQRRLTEQVGTANSSSDIIAERIAALDGLIARENSSVSDALQSGGSLGDNFASLLATVRAQNDGLRSTVSRTEAAMATLRDASARAQTVRSKVDEMQSLFAQGGADIRATRDSVRAVAELSRKLSDINTVIAKIAAQTNLLAMNAAIEAAHAGEAGAGFSVVADEIRKLAEDTARQTKDSQSSLGAVVGEVKKALQVSERTTGAFDSLDKAFAEVRGNTEAVADSMRDQDAANEAIVEALRSSSRSVEETESLASSLDSRSAALMRCLGTLQGDQRNTNENAQSMRVANEALKAAMASLRDLSEQSSMLNAHLAQLLSGFKV